MSELDSLQNTLNHAIDAIREEIAAGGFPELSTLSTEAHPFDQPSPLPSAKFCDARKNALATLNRLEVLIQNPYQRITQQIYSVYDAASLDAVVKMGVVDALLNAPDRRRGLHVDELQSKLDVDASKLAIVLRLLCSKGWFHETSYGVFAVTRPTIQLAQGKNGWKVVGPPGKPKIADCLLGMLAHPQWKFSESANQTAYQLAFNTDLTMFEHLYQYGDEVTKAAFANHIKGLGDELSPGTIEDFPWLELDGRTIIDCGGGQGSLALLLAPKMQKTTFVVQDLSGPLSLAKTNLQTNFPDLWNSGRIVLEEHNFFEPQTQKGSDKVFILKWVLHNWSNEESIKIMKGIAKGGGKGAKLLIVEFIVEPGTIKTSDGSAVPKESSSSSVPAYIPEDYGYASTFVHEMSVHMMAMCNARERTLMEYESLINQSGMKLVKLWNTRSLLSIIEAEVC
ncbi:S-adenosyl-L-methionine-dependent methyltransferase, partial [Dendrothele bispora CBS 962.96]